jgi:uncharacterized membrane protein (UPF0127 family)
MPSVSTAGRPNPSSRSRSVPARVRVAAAAVVALGALAGMVVLILRIRTDESGVGHLRFATTSPARAPFGEFDESRVAVGSRCLLVLVAADPARRTQGLREVRSLAPYDGMLFVNPGDTRADFTMADTPVPLDIIFFSSAGMPVDHQQMKPCPSGSDATCPEYASKAPYRYALEQPSGSAAAPGALGACA